MKKRHIPIFMSVDDNYLPYLVVTMKSLSMYSSDDYIYDIRILNRGLAPYNIRKLRHMKFRNLNIMLVNVDEQAAEYRDKFESRLRDYYSESIYYRLFIADMYPRISKAIYIDCDIILKRDIADLYFVDIGDNILGAVTDESVVNVSEFRDYVEGWVGVEPQRYFNSGVLLMNLGAFRKNKISERFSELIKKYNFDTIAPDQDYLNYLCRGKIYYLPTVWNKQPIVNDEVEYEDINLIHYNFSAKPWHYKDVMYAEDFWRVAVSTPMFDDIVVELTGYDDEQKKRDSENGKKLLMRAAFLAEQSGGFRDIPY